MKAEVWCSLPSYQLSGGWLAVVFILCLPFLPPGLPAPVAIKYSSDLNLNLPSVVSSWSPLLSSNLVTQHNRSEQEVALRESFADWQDIISHCPVCCSSVLFLSRALERELNQC